MKVSQIPRFSISEKMDGSRELIMAQYESCSRFIPTIYLILISSLWGIAITCRGLDMVPVVFIPPALFAVFVLFRVYFWFDSRPELVTFEQAKRELLQTKIGTIALPVIFTAWALYLFEHSAYDIRVNVTYFMAMSGVCIVVFLMNLRVIAIQTALIVYVPLISRLFLTHDPGHIAMAINLIVVNLLLLTVVYFQSKRFAETVFVKLALQEASNHNKILANQDSLTGLANRRLFFSKLESEVAFAKSQGHRLAVGIVDLDGFKAVNDLYGHNAGDQLLRLVAERLLDTTDPDILVSRLGGDEFALLVPNRSSDFELLLLGEKLCSVLNEPFEIEDKIVRISGSIGYAVFPEVADSAVALYESADYALYHSKHNNRGNPVLFNEEQAVEIEADARVAQALRTADLEEELTVYFQPIVNVHSGQAIAFEALARWHNPKIGSMSPSVFIPLAEQSGQICEITQILLKKALKVAEQWPLQIRLSFNLSVHDLGSPEKILALTSILMNSSFSPHRVDFEITETAVIGNLSRSLNAIETLKGLGCGISLDDFGTGYSCLSQLRNLPITKIKIDRSFVSGLDNKPASYKIVKSLLSLSQEMGLGCIVEGIETEVELQLLKQMGGQVVQGYYYSPPVPAQELWRFLPASDGSASCIENSA
ncbi:EAL domain-containing protein [uncultured Cohaesibacter sp.]|uniref:putative bifunctional diguanylate cyclase/phosphodiesterase n=1 Tax=uncultured Cohaesibacter sp. TaxID=1002546 RepID=UPI002931A1CF|nr:EAL domain-containing protein [uncultured Cohaesibacter sp.]